MRVFFYRHWDAELALVGQWAEAAEEKLRVLHTALWSDSPPGLREGADGATLTLLGELDHPLARVLLVMYHVVGQRFARGTDETQSAANNDRLRHAAQRILSEPPIANVEMNWVSRLVARGTLLPTDGAYVRGMALAVMRDVAQAEDAALLLARWAPPESSELDGEAAGTMAATDSADERVEAVGALTALVKREPALWSWAGIEDRLLALITDDQSVPVRIAALQALMTISPSVRAGAVLRSIVETETGTAAELAWAAAIALHNQDPAASAALVLTVFRRATRPAGFSALFTQLELLAEEATLRVALSRFGGTSPLIWRNLDYTMFVLCQPDGCAPPDADDPELREIAAQWLLSTPVVRATLLTRLAAGGLATGRALAVLIGPGTNDPDADAAEDEEGLGPTPESTPAAAVDWLLLARLVLTDPPLTLLRVADGRTLVEPDSQVCPTTALPLDLGLCAANHGAAIALLGSIGDLVDGDILIRHLSTDSVRRNETLLMTTLDALYVHVQRYGQLLSDASLLAALTALTPEGSVEVRQRAVLLLGRFPTLVTGSLLRELSFDPTNTVCCIAERALAEQNAG